MRSSTGSSSEASRISAPAKNKVMPAFGDNKNVMCYLDDIYVYLARPIGRCIAAEGRKSTKRSHRRRPRRRRHVSARSTSHKTHEISGRQHRCCADFRRLFDRGCVSAQTGEAGSIELVDPKVLRVCADPGICLSRMRLARGSRTRSPRCWRASSAKRSPRTIIPAQPASCATR